MHHVEPKSSLILQTWVKTVLFVEYVKKWKQSARLSVSDGWQITQDKRLELHILPFIGHLELESISPEDISRVLNASKDLGHKPATTMQVYLLLSKMFNDAIHLFELRSTSPIRKTYHKPKLVKKESRFLKAIEVEILLSYVTDQKHWARIPIYIQCLVGVRVGEVIALKWKDVDFEKEEILICAKYNKALKRIDEFTKNGQPLRVPMKGALRDVLKAEFLRTNPKLNDFVCRSINGGMMSYNSYQKVLKLVCQKAGVGLMHTHGLRHSCTELWITEGANEKDVGRLLNHEWEATTKNYIHRSDERLNAMAAKVMARFEPKQSLLISFMIKIKRFLSNLF